MKLSNWLQRECHVELLLSSELQAEAKPTKRGRNLLLMHFSNASFTSLPALTTRRLQQQQQHRLDD